MSTLRVNTIQNVAGSGSPDINGTAKAWVNFNGTGTVAIRASFNVSSITDNGAADYTVNFTNAMIDANYVVTANCEYAGGASAAVTPFSDYGGTYTSTQVRIAMRATDYGFYDRSIVGVAIFR
jgi:hypothetical protein